MFLILSLFGGVDALRNRLDNSGSGGLNGGPRNLIVLNKAVATKDPCRARRAPQAPTQTHNPSEGGGQ